MRINPKKKKNFSFSGQPVSLKQKVQHASAQGNYGGLVCLYHSLLSALGVGARIPLSRHLKILTSACQVNFQTKKMRHHRFSAVPKALCQWDRACHPTGLPLHTHTKGPTVDIFFVVCLFCVHRGKLIRHSVLGWGMLGLLLKADWLPQERKLFFLFN